MKQVFEGIKVADFSWYAVGPIIARYLAQHGAQVIHIESSRRVDGLRSSPPFKDGKPGINRALVFATHNCNKFGTTLNLAHPKGPEIARRIVAWADIVVDNFTPGTLDRRGLGYKDLRKVKPDIIMVSSTNQGQAGPHASRPGFGTHLAALSGFVHATGWPDRSPAQPFLAYTDYIAARFATAALVAALDYRQRTGKGQFIDVSQYETSLHYLAPYILDFVVNGRVATRMGNRSPCASPHGVYPCQEKERWCAIAVLTEGDWQNFCQAIGNPGWTQDPRFATLSGRQENEEELDKLVAQWTSCLTAEEAMTRLQAAGVAAGMVKNGRDIFEDPQLRHRHQLQKLNHPEIGEHMYDAPAFLFSETPCEISVPGPSLGQHNEYVYTQLLGMSDEEFTQLLAEGVFD